MGENISVSTLSQVAGEQLVCVKGEVRQLSATKTVVFDKASVKKQHFIVDPSGSIKLVLYGKHTDTVEEGKVYQFKKVRVKATKMRDMLTPPKMRMSVLFLQLSLLVKPCLL